MKFLIILLLTFGLFACATDPQIVTSQKRVKIEVSEALFECPTIKSWPNPEKLTDIQVAKLIVQLHRNNTKCKTSIEAIHKFVEDYNSTVSE